MKYCSHCGEKLEDNGKFCPKCGAEVQEDGGIQLQQPAAKNVYVEQRGRKSHGCLISILVFILVVFVVFFMIAIFSSDEKDNKGVTTAGDEMQQEDTEEDSENKIYYPGDTAYGDTITTYVDYAYAEDSYGSNIINVQCNITNSSDDSITFSARDYYQLDNDGLTTDVNMTDYEYKEIASGYSFKAKLTFTCPEGSNKDLSSMTMTADNLTFNLGSKPQNEEEMAGLAGTYSRFEGSSRITITDNGDDTYNIRQVTVIGSDAYINNYKNVYLDENNYVRSGETMHYLWKPEEYALYSCDSLSGKLNEDQKEWVKE